MCLVADKNIEAALRGLFEKRAPSLGIRQFRFEIFVHPERDPGCYKRGLELLERLIGSARHGLLVFDQAWEGNPHSNRVETENELRSGSGQMAGRVEVLVIEPEIEAWVWSTSPHVERVLRWSDDPSVRRWLTQQGLWVKGAAKPGDPKEAMEQVLRRTGTPRSSALYRELAGRVSLASCTDPAFARLKEILGQWFPAR